MIGTTDSYMTKITVFSSSLLFTELQVSLEISWSSRFGTLLQPQLSLEMLQSMKEFTTKIKNVIKKSFFFQSKRRYVFIEGSNWHRQWWLQHLYGKKKKKQIIPHPSYTGQSSTPSSETNVDNFATFFFSYLKEGEIRDLTSQRFIFFFKVQENY